MSTTDTQETAERGDPDGFWLALPEGWFILDLDPRTAEAGIDQLLASRLAEDPTLAPEIGELKQVLLRTAAEADKAGVEFTACYAAAIGEDLLVTASLGVVVHTIGEQVSLRSIEEGLTERGAGPRMSMVESAAGPAAKVRDRSVIPIPGSEQQLEVALRHYYVPVPGGHRIALLSFSTPTLPLEDDLDQLFDAMVGSFQFTWDEDEG